MKTAAFLSIALASTLATAVIACSSTPDPAPASKTDKNTKKTTGDDDDDGTGSPTAGPSAAPSAAAASATPSGSTTAPAPATGTPPKGMDPKDYQCMMTCIGSDQAATSLFSTENACLDKCGETDEQCANKCFDASGATCEKTPAPCDKLDQCGQKCFPDEGGQGGGN